MAQQQRGPPRGGEGRKVMTLPVNVIFNFFKSKARVSVWLYDQSDLRIEGALLPLSLAPVLALCSSSKCVLIGVVMGFDEYMNIVLDNAEEVNKKKNTRKDIGRILLKGDNISLLMGTGK